MILSKENITGINFKRLIGEKLEAGKLQELLLIYPTKRKIRTLRKELIASMPDKTACNINLETIGTFSTSILLQKVKFKPVCEAAAAVLLKQSVSEVQLKYFSGYKHEIPSGTMDRISNVISEYKRHGITPDLLRREALQLRGADALKAADVANIYERYTENCRRLLARETGDIYNEVITFPKGDFNSSFRKCYPDVNIAIINGFDEFTSLEIDIINMISLVSGIRIFVYFDYYTFNAPVFSHLQECYNKFKKKGFNIIEDRTVSGMDEFQKDIRERLFLKQPGSMPSHTYKEHITKITAINREKEIELIAKEIKDLILLHGVKPHKICLAFNLNEKYSPIVRDCFALNKIPVNITDRIWLDSSAAVISLISFLEILENDFFYKNILRALSSGFLDFKGVSFSALLKVSSSLKVVSGYDNWIESLSVAIENTDPSDPEAVRQKKLYGKVLSDIELIYKFLKPFDKKLTLKEFAALLLELIGRLDMKEKLLQGSSQRQEENIKAVNTFIETVTEVFELYERHFYKDEKFPLRFFLDKIRTAISSARYNVQEKSSYGVLVTTLNEIRGLNFDFLFIAGLVDGDLPTRYSPEIFYSGSFARTHNENVHQTEERYHFYQTLCAWEKKLYLCHPMQESGKELVESNFLKDLNLLFKFTPKTEKDYEGAVYNNNEFQQLIAGSGADILKSTYPELEDKYRWDEINKALSVSYSRAENPFGETIYTGFLNLKESESNTEGIKNLPLSEKAKETLENYSKRLYSISQLEKYALCPYQYFLLRVLNVEVPEEPTEDVESFELGMLLHSILFEFYIQLNEKGIIFQRCSDEEFRKAEKLIFEIAATRIQEMGFRSPFSSYERERILGINGNRRSSILYKFLEYEHKDDCGFSPGYFEVGFGALPAEEADKNLKGSFVFKIGEINVRGKIDRIDVNTEANAFNIIDYKLSGKKPTSEELNTGLSLQLPLYMYAASEIFKSQSGEEYYPAGGYIYSLKFKTKDFGKIAVAGKLKANKTFSELTDEERLEIIASNQELIGVCRESIEKYVRNIKDGMFNLTLLPDCESKVCSFCDFHSICRILETE